MGNFKTKAFLLVVALVSMMAFEAQAKLVHLAYITSNSKDDEGTYSQFILETDAKEDALALYKRQYRMTQDNVIAPPKDTLILNKRFDLSAYASGAGSLVLEEKKGRQVVVLKAQNFALHNGGVITIDYLHNGINGERGSIQVTMNREGDEWFLSRQGKRVTSMHFEVNKKFAIGEVGIEQVIIRTR